ncbi:DUF3800 domain-containing protein [Acidithiobacillus sulfuriphilus]|uniref:DUF3800 domain-containing protein n=2 Tax=Acidithiobacillus sulfuriphilus TaxID=1867749 RepID=A0A3M8S7M1_9PROT|nr:DUF3800 domain-containing protein [Acidithiobacillus sulfuriphilus]RNF75866.1 DUF3800 domain-containing protein [Acidithiobacillus sulfuriphilus]
MNTTASTPLINIYVDESCHLPADRQTVMALGALWCPQTEVRRLSAALRDLKARHRARGELKWSKVSASRLAFYCDLVDWFVAEEPLHFRGLVVLDKQQLNHAAFNQGDHDLFYYKMQFSLLNRILSPDSRYAIYLDIKDTRSRLKLHKLREVLCNNVYDFTSAMIGHIQNIHSHEAELMQLADFFSGALTYRHRGLQGNPAKLAVIDHIEQRLGRSLLQATPLRETKLNVFLFHPRRVGP